MPEALAARPYSVFGARSGVRADQYHVVGDKMQSAQPSAEQVNHTARHQDGVCTVACVAPLDGSNHTQEHYADPPANLGMPFWNLQSDNMS